MLLMQRAQLRLVLVGAVFILLSRATAAEEKPLPKDAKTTVTPSASSVPENQPVTVDVPLAVLLSEVDRIFEMLRPQIE